MEPQSTKPEDLFARLAGQTVETMTIWAEANQQVLTQLADLTAGTAKESARLYAELQQSTLKALGATPIAMPWQPSWQESCQQALKAFEGNVQAMSRSAERLQASAEQAGKTLQETFAATATRIRSLYAR
jgi:hypothetical protein